VAGPMESDCAMEDSARSHGGDWILLFHGVSDNRTGVLVRLSFCCVMATTS